MHAKGSVSYVTGTFYIEPGVQTVICHKDSLREIPDIRNNTMKEVNGRFKHAMAGYTLACSELDSYYDSLHTAFGRSLPDSAQLEWRNKKLYLQDTLYPHILLDYTKKYPSSYVAFWHLPAHYLPVYDNIYNTFSAALKQSDAGRELKKTLDGSRTISIGQKFSGFTLQDTAYTVKNVVLKEGTHKYTLIDFWESHCGPCKAQFAQYKTKYAAYKKAGVEIIAVSTDITKYITLWKNTIQEKGYPWPQYLDENARLAASLSINVYPSNFLLDEHNVIIGKNLTPQQLEQIVNQH